MKAGMIDVSGAPLENLVRGAYALSRTQGLGAFHYVPGGLTDDEVAEIIARGNEHTAISMDYVKGRSCKFHVRRDGDRLLINNRWYDHSDAELRSLLQQVSLSPDLVDRARAEEQSYIESAVAEAVAFVRANGGFFIEKNVDHQAGKHLPDRLQDGLIYGTGDDGPLKAEWVEDGRKYSIAP